MRSVSYISFGGAAVCQSRIIAVSRDSISVNTELSILLSLYDLTAGDY